MSRVPIPNHQHWDTDLSCHPTRPQAFSSEPANRDEKGIGSWDGSSLRLRCCVIKCSDRRKGTKCSVRSEGRARTEFLTQPSCHPICHRRVLGWTICVNRGNDLAISLQRFNRRSHRSAMRAVDDVPVRHVHCKERASGSRTSAHKPQRTGLRRARRASQDAVLRSSTITRSI